MEIHSGMSHMNRQAVSDGLSQLLADSYALYLKAQNFHWNVTGSDFYSLHLFFEKQYEDLSEAIDEIAERIRALGFYVDASFSGFKAMAALSEEKRVLNQREMIEHLLKGHESVTRLLRELSPVAEHEKDYATVDLIGRRLNAHEKFAWMLRSHI